MVKVVSSFLVRSGITPLPIENIHLKCLLKMNEFAKANKLGMWAMTFQIPISIFPLAIPLYSENGQAAINIYNCFANNRLNRVKYI